VVLFIGSHMKNLLMSRGGNSPTKLQSQQHIQSKFKVLTSKS